ncbi:hypothetical protein EDD65_101215 [Keratinibaculum paraultunense]|uniref:Uncharacterized protein n=1 Tax=Keratinibaculum paraultunense TaxID=1278232 RepID=A0A4R3KZW1_9FIRM|nr:hypothetical protein [Keratinibaculum paraultunense]QQY79967.1 hypothetical protein JL105_01135 [Keratinibaculum paraultunense]TCS91712.1 hypothetical protein EDD65_101215 [Keratinibaculum paraultunense]
MDFIEKNIKGIFIGYIVSAFLYIGQVYYNGKFGSIRPHTMIYALFTLPLLIWITRRMVGKYGAIKQFGIYSFGVYFSHPKYIPRNRREEEYV